MAARWAITSVGVTRRRRRLDDERGERRSRGSNRRPRPGDRTGKHIDPRADVAVLVVHGIGAQRPGATLDSLRVPLHDRLLKVDGVSAISETRKPETGDTAASATWKITLPGGRKQGWLLAEARWADSFPGPNNRRLARWLFRRSWWLIMFHFSASVLPRFFAAGKATEDPDLRTKVIAFAKLVGYLPVQASALLWRVCVWPLLALCAAILWLGRPQRLVLLLNAFVGDAYALIESDEAREAMLARIERDYLHLRRRARHLIVVAHSQGAMLSREGSRAPR